MKTCAVLLIAMSGLALSGCGCSVFSSKHAPHCQALFLGMAIVTVPYALVDEMREDRQEKKEQRRQRELVLSGDMSALIDCTLECNGYSHLDDRWKLQALSAEKLIAAWDEAPEANQLPVLLSAHAILGRELAKQDLPEATSHWIRVASLSTDSRIAGALEAGDHTLIGRDYYLNSYSWLAVDAQRFFILSAYRDGGKVYSSREEFSELCEPRYSWPPTWRSLFSGDWPKAIEYACDRSFEEVQSERKRQEGGGQQSNLTSQFSD